MKLSTLFSWIGKKEQDQWVDIDVASCMAAAGHEEIYYPYKGYLRFNTATRKLEGVIVFPPSTTIANDADFLILPEEIVSTVTGVIGIGIASQATPTGIVVGVTAGSRALKNVQCIAIEISQPVYLINGYI